MNYKNNLEKAFITDTYPEHNLISLFNFREKYKQRTSNILLKNYFNSIDFVKKSESINENDFYYINKLFIKKYSKEPLSLNELKSINLKSFSNYEILSDLVNYITNFCLILLKKNIQMIISFLFSLIKRLINLSKINIRMKLYQILISINIIHLFL